MNTSTTLGLAGMVPFSALLASSGVGPGVEGWHLGNAMRILEYGRVYSSAYSIERIWDSTDEVDSMSIAQ